MYQEHTRHRSEAELRFGVALPTVAIGFVVGVGSTPAVTALVTFAATVAAGALFVQAASRSKSAGDIIAVAVGDSLISTPTLDVADWWIETKR